jgi:hypothetical protein
MCRLIVILTVYLLLISNYNVCFSIQDSLKHNKLHKDTICTFPWPDAIKDSLAMQQKRQVLRAKMKIDSSTSIQIFERPKSPIYYDSLIIVRRKSQPIQSYDIGRMIKGGQVLRLLYSAMVYTEARNGMLILGFEGGGDGSTQGFAIIYFSPAFIELQVLPITYNGKVVVFQNDKKHVELWTRSNEIGESEVAPVHYEIRDCYLYKDGFHCNSTPRIVGLYSKLEIIDPSIEIR